MPWRYQQLLTMYKRLQCSQYIIRVSIPSYCRQIQRFGDTWRKIEEREGTECLVSSIRSELYVCCMATRSTQAGFRYQIFNISHCTSLLLPIKSWLYWCTKPGTDGTWRRLVQYLEALCVRIFPCTWRTYWLAFLLMYSMNISQGYIYTVSH